MFRSIPNSISPELQLILHFAQIDTSKIWCDNNVIQKINWEKYNKLASYHQLNLITSEGIKNEKKIDIPPKIEAHFKSISTPFIIQNLILKTEYKNLAHLFEEKKIAIIPFKGVFFSLFFYPNQNRESSDLDFLIDKNDFKKVVEVLQNEGFSMESDLLIKEPIKSFEYMDEIGGMELTFTKKLKNGFNLVFDLHWNLMTKYHNQGSKFDVNDLFKEDVTHVEKTFWTIIVHNGRREAWSKLKYVIDFSAFLYKFNADLNWKLLEEKAIKYGLKNTLVNGLQLTNKFFGNTIHFEFNQSNLDFRPYISIWEKANSWEKSFSARYNFEKLIFSQADEGFSKIKFIKDYLKFQSFPKFKDDLRLYTFPKEWFILNFLSKAISYLYNNLINPRK